MARPPIAYAPGREVEMSAPGIPTSLPRHAEKLVIERARELVKIHPDHPDFSKLQEAVRVLDVLEGKRDS